MSKVTGVIGYLCARIGARRLALRRAGPFIAGGDAARDLKNWEAAARSYRTALQWDPGNAGIWIQLGHALKESGNRVGGLNAYLRALELEPRNSDAALQLGHVTKLLGRKEEAVGWYKQALAWPPGEIDAIRELQALGMERGELERLAEREEYPPPAPQPRPAQRLLWDATAAWEAARSGRPASLQAAWSLELGMRLGAAPCALCPEASTWRAIGAEGAERLAAWCNDAGAAEKLACPVGHDLEGGAALIVSPDSCFDPDRLSVALRTFEHATRTPVVAFVPTALPWERPEWASLDADGAARSLAILDVLLRQCAAVLAPTQQDLGPIVARASALGAAPMSAALEWRCARRAVMPGEDPVDGPDVALLPASPRELAVLVQAHAQLKRARMQSRDADRGRERRLVLIANSRDAKAAEDALERAVDQSAHAPADVAIHPPNVASARALLASARTFVAPLSRVDAGFWLAEACAAVAPIIAGRSARSYALFGAAIDDYACFEDPLALSASWGALTGRRQPLPRGDAWAEALRASLAPIVQDAAMAQVPAAAKVGIGTFYGLAAGKDPPAFRIGAGWRRRMPHGAEVSGEGGRLAFVLANRFLGRCRLAVLVCAPGCPSIRLELTACDRTAACDFQPAEEGWGWATMEFSPLVHAATPVVVEVTHAAPSAPCAPVDLPAIAGLIVYPVDEDRYWFEFLDRASRGEVDEVRAVRTMARQRRRSRSPGGAGLASGAHLPGAGLVLHKSDEPMPAAGVTNEAL